MAKGTRPHSRCGKPYRIEILQSTSVFCGMTEILAVQAPCGRCRTRIVLISSVLKKGLRPFLRNDRDSNSGNAFDVYTLSRQLSPIANDWLIISCLKPVPACAYVARKIYAAKLIIFFDVAITFAPFLSFFFLNVRDSIGC